MSHLPARWNAFVVVLALATLVGCQGFSSGKSNSQSTQTPTGTLSASPSTAAFGNTQVGNAQAITDTLSNTGTASLTITQATVTGAGFSTGLNLPITLAAGQSVKFNIIFGPESLGSASGNLALVNSGSNSPFNIVLSATAVAAGSLTGSPTSISFGSVQVGVGQTQTETLKNVGADSLTVTQASLTGAGFSYTGLSLPMTLLPNQSTTFGVVFTPTSAGAASSTLSIANSGSSTALDVALSGTGVTPAMLGASPTSFTFNNVTVGQNQTQSETVTNTGGMSATVSQATVSGSGFSISGLSTPLTLASGQSTSFSVTFAPQSAGSASGSVMVDSNAANPALSIGLSGSAVAQSQGTLSASAVNVGSVVVGTSGTQTGTLSVTGGSISVSSVTLSGSGSSEFSIGGLTFPVTVTPTQPATFTVKFTPGSSGEASVSASFASSAANTPTAASLTGTGTPAPVHTVSLSWTASATSGVTSYNIYRAVLAGSSCGSYSNVGSTAGSVTEYTDSGLTDGTTYCYATTAVDPTGESGHSNIAQAVIPAP